ncbi:hypothetical protein D3C76_1587520 [compost metagenome]
MHAERRNAPGKGQCLSAGSTHQQGTDQARARGISDGVDLGWHTVGFGQDLTNQGQHALDVITRGQFRHYATIRTVQVDLAEQRVGQQASFTVVECDTSFVARGF